MVVEKRASGDFDYRREESAGSDGVDVFDEENGDGSEANFDHLLTEDEARQGNGFDPFDENNWVDVLSPAPTPWYRSPQARALLIASGTALSAIVISVVLLMLRQTPAGDRPGPAPTTAPVATPTATASSEPPPPPPPPPEPEPEPEPEPPPPPPPPEPSTMDRAPAVNGPTVRPRPPREPEIGVTRTPATRAPMSVAPQPRRPRS
jgi:outer membrane biosynthesis protein TonB